ncbi:LAGLIDADG family homing endonuclease, partial [Streptomyces sp. NPDC056670]|uniref:LAGLIDADG family homing endonuclease n=1 Tax=Streptomyces sp. NPDC056670 TaxID=3345904 RepID=UPI0036ABFBA7
TEYLRARLKARWRVDLVKPVQFEGLSSLPVDPYLLGALLGDGSLTGSSPCLSADGDAVVNEVRAVLPEGLEIRKTSASNYSWSITSGRRGTRSNPLSQALRQLGVNGLYSHEKYIPAVYMAASENDRLALLQGLLDTDGSCDRKYTGVRFHTCSSALADNVADLVRGLGGRAYVHNDGGRKGTRRQMYTVGIVMPQDMVPFRAQMPKRLHRYLASSTRRPALGKTIVSIEPDGFEEMQCISVAAEDRLYVTSGYTLTHNTIPMWIDDPTGQERRDNPKAKTRVTESGKTQVLIFRRAARIGERKRVYRRDPKTGLKILVSDKPAHYPGAPGRIAWREAKQPWTRPGRRGGAIHPGNIGVWWRHPGIKPRSFLNTSMTAAAQKAGLLPERVYVADKGWRNYVRLHGEEFR